MNVVVVCVVVVFALFFALSNFEFLEQIFEIREPNEIQKATVDGAWATHSVRVLCVYVFFVSVWLSPIVPDVDRRHGRNVGDHKSLAIGTGPNLDNNDNDV